MSSGATTDTRPTTTNTNRYWCHVCNAEVNIYMAPDPTCQQCNETFIEELQPDDDPREFLTGVNAAAQAQPGFNIPLPEGGSAHVFSYSPSTGRFVNLHGGTGRGGGAGGEMGDDMFQYFTPRNNVNEEVGADRTTGNQQQQQAPLSNLIQNLLSNILGANIEITTQQTRNGDATTTTEGSEGGGATRPMMFYGSMVDGNVRFSAMPPGANRMPGGMPGEEDDDDDNNNTNDEAGQQPGTQETEGDRERGRRGNDIASLLQFFSAMTGGQFDAGLIGNPNDYVFSQTALDDIITRLMEQTSGASAPPPAPDQVIESLKKRELTENEKSKEADCAVCKDQFENHEQVIELPCEHIFHDDCIKPWLKLNSTCPVCRHSVLPEGAAGAGERDNNNNTTSDNNSNSNNNHTQQQQQQQQQSNNNNNNNNNNNSETTRTATFSWVGGTGNNNEQGSSWPLNLSASFPWNLTSPSGNSSPRNNTQQSSSTTDNNTNTSNTVNNNNNMNNLHNEDLDLD